MDALRHTLGAAIAFDTIFARRQTFSPWQNPFSGNRIVLDYMHLVTVMQQYYSDGKWPTNFRGNVCEPFSGPKIRVKASGKLNINKAMTLLPKM